MQPIDSQAQKIQAKAVRRLCGGISDMTLWRWLHSENMGFPRPVTIKRIRYWREAEVIAWLDSREVVA